jgi:hypothetical protein
VRLIKNVLKFKTNLKEENWNILQIPEKKISTISLARQHLNANKESPDVSVHLEGRTS